MKKDRRYCLTRARRSKGDDTYDISDTTIKPQRSSGVNNAGLDGSFNIVTAQQRGAEDSTPATTVAIPEPAEKRWVVVVCDWEYADDEEDGHSKVYTPVYALTPKGGGPASLLDEKTWGDASMAHMRLKIFVEKNEHTLRTRGRIVRLGFVHEGELFWKNGEPAVKREVR